MIHYLHRVKGAYSKGANLYRAIKGDTLKTIQTLRKKFLEKP